MALFGSSLEPLCFQALEGRVDVGPADGSPRAFFDVGSDRNGVRLVRAQPGAGEHDEQFEVSQDVRRHHTPPF